MAFNRCCGETAINLGGLVSTGLDRTGVNVMLKVNAIQCAGARRLLHDQLAAVVATSKCESKTKGKRFNCGFGEVIRLGAYERFSFTEVV
jgi:hypothetical protein